MGRHRLLRIAHSFGPALHASLFRRRPNSHRGFPPVNFLVNLGRVIVALLAQTGRVVLFIKDSLFAAVTLPILVAIGDTIGIMGGYIVGTRSLGFNSYAYIKNTTTNLHFDDVTSGLIKAAAFGFIIAIMGCYHGFNSKGGAQGVGRATTNAVVSAAILILAANFALTSLLFSD